MKLLKEIGAEVVAAVFVIDLPDLGGARKIEGLGVPVSVAGGVSRALITTVS